ncbi:MAG TPA: FKBP-type peptidyl-prolyl cis-trans isomerase [Candidatus Bathyarchaeia archaeon]
MAAKTGDFLLLNYTLKVKESGETVDTTFDSVAKDAEIHREDAAYGPKFVILGEGWLPKGLEDSLVGLDAGKQTTIELPPEKGYGTRDPGRMRLVSLRRFREKGIDPAPGAQVEFEGRPAVVRAVGAGRVQVDYNHPLAGRTLIYEVSIERVLEDENEKILNIISRRIPEISLGRFGLNRSATDLTVEVPEEAFYLSGLQVAKKSITSDLQKYIPEIGSISFMEIFKRTDKAESEPTGEPAAQGSPLPAEEKPAAKESAEQQAPRKPEPTPRRAATRTTRRRPRLGSENQR